VGWMKCTFFAWVVLAIVYLINTTCGFFFPTNIFLILPFFSSAAPPFPLNILYGNCDLMKKYHLWNTAFWVSSGLLNF